MPIYLYQSPETQEIKEIFQSMTEEHVYFDDKGIEWNRILTTPNIAIDTQVSPNSSKDFLKATAKKGMTFGQMSDLSAELSEKRGGMSGQDEMKQKVVDDYKKRTGKEHPVIANEKRKKLKDQLKNLSIG
jgi:hypothetical protein